MDGHKFDQMTRTLANSADRRSVIRGLAGAALAMFGIGASSARMQDDDIISTAMQFQACMQSNLAMIDEAQELTPEGYQLVVRITQTLVDAAYETTETGRNPLLLTAVLVRLAIVDIPWFIGAAQNCISAFARGEFRSRVYNRVRQQVPACKPYFPELPEGPAYGCSRNQICCQESCTDPCPDGQSLDPDSCLCTCDNGLTNCDGQCVDLESDSLSCGECGISCDFLNGEICCDGVCADLASDSQNCGTCGGVCESGVCINGECVSDTCSDGLTRCNGECVDLESDANSCGACGTICGENEMCVVGRCVTDSQYRIVLTWGAAPSDLDSHLWLPEATPYHVYYANQGTTTAFPWAELDRDDTSSYGPETITLANVLAGTYSYAVYNYSGGSPLTSSGAVVELYRGSELLRSYSVPGGSDERWWQVFYLASDGTITDVNALIPLGESPGPYNAFSGTVQAIAPSDGSTFRIAAVGSKPPPGPDYPAREEPAVDAQPSVASNAEASTETPTESPTAAPEPTPTEVPAEPTPVPTESTIECPSGLMLCGDVCVYPAADPFNCGGCGVVCASGHYCADGVCVSAIPTERLEEEPVMKPDPADATPTSND